MPELMVGLVIAAILVLAVSGVLAGDQFAWSDVYDRVYGNVATGSDLARRTFDTMVHRGSKSNSLVDAGGTWFEVQYYGSQTSSAVDSYAHFSVSGGNLNVEYGQLNPKVAQTTVTLCGNVTSRLFLRTGDSAQMALTLNDGLHSRTITSSAVMHVK
jgi:hypothetical protein